MPKVTYALHGNVPNKDVFVARVVQLAKEMGVVFTCIPWLNIDDRYWIDPHTGETVAAKKEREDLNL